MSSNRSRSRKGEKVSTKPLSQSPSGDMKPSAKASTSASSAKPLLSAAKPKFSSPCVICLAMKNRTIQYHTLRNCPVLIENDEPEFSICDLERRYPNSGAYVEDDVVIEEESGESANFTSYLLDEDLFGDDVSVDGDTLSVEDFASEEAIIASEVGDLSANILAEKPPQTVILADNEVTSELALDNSLILENKEAYGCGDVVVSEACDATQFDNYTNLAVTSFVNIPSIYCCEGRILNERTIDRSSDEDPEERIGGYNLSDLIANGIDRAKAIFGRPEAELRGDSTDTRPRRAVLVSIMRLVSTVLDLLVGVFFANGLFSSEISVQTESWIVMHMMRDRWKALRNVLAHIQASELRIHDLLTNEGPVLLAIKDGIEFDPKMVSAAGESISVVERAARTGKDRVRDLFSALAFRLTQLILTHLVIYSFSSLFHFPNHSSKTVPTRELKIGSKFDFAAHSQVDFGNYCHTESHFRPALKLMQVDGIGSTNIAHACVVPRASGCSVLSDKVPVIIFGVYYYEGEAASKVLEPKRVLEVPSDRALTKHAEGYARSDIVRHDVARIKTTSGGSEAELHDLILFGFASLNHFPSRISSTMASPRELMSGVKFDVEAHGRVGIGDYCHAEVKDSSRDRNSVTKFRMQPVIALLPLFNQEGTVKCLNLASGQVISCTKLTPLPMPQSVVEYLNAMAAAEKASDPTSRSHLVPTFTWRDQEVPDEQKEGAGAEEDLSDIAPLPAFHTPPALSDETIRALAPPDSSSSDPVRVIDGEAAPDTTERVEASHGDSDQPLLSADHGGGRDVIPPSSTNQEPPEPDPGVLDPGVQEQRAPSPESEPEPPPPSSSEEESGSTKGPSVSSPEATRRSSRVAKPIGNAKSAPVEHYTNRSSAARPKRQGPSKLQQPPEKPTVALHVPERKVKATPKTKVTVEKPEVGLHMSVNAAMNKLGRKALTALAGECLQLHDNGVFVPVKASSLSFFQIKKVIRSSVFFKEKYLSTGEFEKIKARLVAGGHMQDKTVYEDISSPTVSTTAAFIVIAIAAKENRKVVKIDVPGAYLKADIGKEEVLMRLNRLETELLAQIDPSYRECINPDGSCIVRLKKALYGLVESARLWYEDLSKTLVGLGYKSNPMEPCVFNLEKDGAQCTIAVHVDDLLITSVSQGLIDYTVKGLTERYGPLAPERGPILSYLGMTLDFSKSGEAKITMEGYTSDLLDFANITGKAATPALPDLFEIDEKSVALSGEAKEHFHSLTAKLLYLAKRTRPELCPLVSFLTTRVQCSTAQDMAKLERGIRYLNAEPNLGIILRADEDMKIFAYIDASFGVHANGMSHTGSLVSLGGGPVYHKSTKQKIVTKSSTEAELVGLSDSVSQVIWTRDFLIAQGYEIDAATCYQDNKSTIIMANKGRSTSERTRHINVRFFFIKDRIATGEVKLEYLPTGEMTADILTKPLQGELFRRLRDKLLGYSR